MKYLFSIFFIIVSNVIFAQHQKIVQLLNKQLQKEYTKFNNEEEKTQFKITQAFYIDENKVLHFGFTLLNNKNGGKTSIKRSVPLEKIVQFDKDLNVYFYTLNKDVAETQDIYNSDDILIKSKTEYSNFFITELNKEYHPNLFMKNLRKAFKKASYDVTGYNAE